MKTCMRINEVEKWFDTGIDPAGVAEHVERCAACRHHLTFLESTRAALQQHAAVIADRTVNAERFLTDFRERAQTPSRHMNPRWGLLSAAAAAFLVAASLFSIFAPENGPVDARSYVESARTEIEGATAETYHAADGTPIVWVNVPEGDMW